MKIHHILIRISTVSVFLMINTAVFGDAVGTLSAREVAFRNVERDEGDNVVSLNMLSLIDKNGEVRTRIIRNYRKVYDQLEKSVFVIESPADVKGTAFLSHDWKDESKEDDSWLYLPALQKTKRISGGDKTNSFMGSEFSFVDLQPLGSNFYDYRFVNQGEEVGGHKVWVIDRTAKPEYTEKVHKETGYLKTRLWIRKDNFITVKAKIFMSNGKRIKYFQASDIEEIDGIWVARRVQMVTTRQGERENSSIIQTENITFNNSLDDLMFSVSGLDRKH